MVERAATLKLPFRAWSTARWTKSRIVVTLVAAVVAIALRERRTVAFGSQGESGSTGGIDGGSTAEGQSGVDCIGFREGDRLRVSSNPVGAALSPDPRNDWEVDR